MAHEGAPEWARSILASVTGIDAKLSSFQVEITASVTEMRSDYGQLAARMDILEASMEQYQSSEDVMADISAEAERQVRMQKLGSMVQKLESQINDTPADGGPPQRRRRALSPASTRSTGISSADGAMGS
eukprot:1845964-Pyramimonas_sp.AAC.1